MLRRRCAVPLLILLIAALPLTACGGGFEATSAPVATAGTPVTGTPAASAPIAVTDVAGAGAVAGAAAGATPPIAPKPSPSATVDPIPATVPVLKAGNPSGQASIPAAARAANTSKPDHVIGKGTPASCTAKAVIAAIAAGGVTTFTCGPKPITITLASTAKVVNAHPDVVLDGGGLVTLSGAGKRRILYQNTCDKAQDWATSNCTDQAHPQLTVQNLTFADGDSTGQLTEGGGGGAIFVRGGRLKVVNSVFVRNRCDTTGPDLGGAAIRVLDQAGDGPVYIVRSTFGGKAGQGGKCSNGGALSSIGVSWVVLNSLFSHNYAVGHGANPASAGTLGGGSGGAIYADGNTFTITLSGTKILQNQANEGGGAVFFVSNDHTGSLSIRSSSLRSNLSKSFETQGYPGIFFLGKGHPNVTDSVLLK